MSSIFQEIQFSILVVDDNLHMRESLRELLAINDIKSTLSEDAQQALEYLEKDHYDLILLDIEIPKNDDFQVLSDIHEQYPDTVIIILSGKASFECLRQALRMGAQDFLIKPCDPSELIEVMHKFAEKKHVNMDKTDNLLETNAQSEVEKVLTGLETIIHNEDISLANEIINSSSVVAFLWKNVPNLPVQFVSDNVLDLLGFTANEFITGVVRYQDIIHYDDITWVIKEVARDNKTRDIHHKPYRIITKYGVVKWLDDCSSTIRDKQGNITHYQGVLTDVTEREHARHKIFQKQLNFKHNSNHDSLTGLPNRLLLQDRMQQSIKKVQREKKQLAVFYIDLDKFKPINDALGFAAGDEVLKAVARRLRKNIRAVDTVARIGGDEFILLMESVSNVRDVKIMAEKLNQSLNQPIHWNMYELCITCSIGISLSPDDGNISQELIEKSDIAMYQSKEKGGSSFQFYRVS